VNGTVKQNSNLLNMSWNVAAGLKTVEAFELKPATSSIPAPRRMSAAVLKATCCCARSRVCRHVDQDRLKRLRMASRESGQRPSISVTALRDTSISKAGGAVWSRTDDQFVRGA